MEKIRSSPWAVFCISILINVGMWSERFVIVVTALSRDFLPGSWRMYYPTWVDIGLFVGTVGFFFMLFLLFTRFFPVISIAEVKTLVYEMERKEYDLKKGTSYGA
ncbi:hypothetical protein [Methylacidiphilum kamchatkense]|uniref:Hydrogenase n=1 Tax=Methylacidiphilum kamchatkense Kam1 TaxID=1202785 RepID=A0A516TK29_9BACT|nr:hypothetical protein [Methylacidiphilum kamchatkense]QDQ41608.1 hypothetical protein kam1_357 [Methylacidiphilum kamchatkense Kam1]